jgi:hypothetical protein
MKRVMKVAITPKPVVASASAIPYHKMTPQHRPKRQWLAFLAFTFGRGSANRIASSATP